MDPNKQLLVLGGLAAAFSIGSIALNLIFAVGISHTDTVTALLIVSYIAPALSVTALFGIAYFSILHVHRLRKPSWEATSSLWGIFAYGTSVSLLANILTGLDLVWTTTSQHRLPHTISNVPLMTLLGAWFGAWAAALVLQVALYLSVGLLTAKALRVNNVGRQELDFGIDARQAPPQPPAAAAAERVMSSSVSVASQDPTLHSPPRTPKSLVASTRGSSSTRVGPPSSSMTKKSRSSRRSSADMPAFPAGEAVSIDCAFDFWDTSSVPRGGGADMRVIMHSSPPLPQPALEPIPGSRAESPANGLDGPFLPSSPLARYRPSKVPSEDETYEDCPSSPVPLPPLPPTAPTTPPNFSRLTTRQPKPALQKAFSPTSSRRSYPARPATPEPVLVDEAETTATTASTPTVAAAAAAAATTTSSSAPSTPKSSVRMRNSAALSSSPMERSERSSFVGSCVLGSPGPSIVESDYGETVSPPPPTTMTTTTTTTTTTTIPSFVLSAGQRTSLVGYGRRKSSKPEKSRLSLVQAEPIF